MSSGSFTDMTGRRVDALLVLERVMGTRPVEWRCRCDCGVTVVVRARNLVERKKPASCGCLGKGGRPATHGYARHGATLPEFRIWTGMKYRCTNPRGRQYPDYGGRGIKVCERWLHSFEAFLEDMGRRPSPKHTLDRYPDNDGNYEPGNCRWATPKEQQRNRRCNRIIEFAGQRLPLSAWGERLGLPPETIAARLDRGCSVERALTAPETRCHYCGAAMGPGRADRKYCTSECQVEANADCKRKGPQCFAG